MQIALLHHKPMRCTFAPMISAALARAHHLLNQDMLGYLDTVELLTNEHDTDDHGDRDELEPMQHPLRNRPLQRRGVAQGRLAGEHAVALEQL